MDPNPNNGPRNRFRACASCHHRRRKCSPDCPLRPFFPPSNDPSNKDFENAKKLFGLKTLREVAKSFTSPALEQVMDSMKTEANIVARDPINGVLGIVNSLEAQINQCQNELNFCLAQIAHFKAKNLNHMNVEFQNLGNFNVENPPNEASNSGLQSDMNVYMNHYGNFSLDEDLAGNLLNSVENNATAEGMINPNHMNVEFQNLGNFNVENHTNEASNSGLPSDMNVYMNHYGNFSLDEDLAGNLLNSVENNATAEGMINPNHMNVEIQNLGNFNVENPTNEATTPDLQSDMNVYMNLYGNSSLDEDLAGYLLNSHENNAAGEEMLNPNIVNELNVGMGGLSNFSLKNDQNPYDQSPSFLGNEAFEVEGDFEQVFKFHSEGATEEGINPVNVNLNLDVEEEFKDDGLRKSNSKILHVENPNNEASTSGVQQNMNLYGNVSLDEDLAVPLMDLLENNATGEGMINPDIGNELNVGMGGLSNFSVHMGFVNEVSSSAGLKNVQHSNAQNRNSQNPNFLVNDAIEEGINPSVHDCNAAVEDGYELFLKHLSEVNTEEGVNLNVNEGNNDGVENEQNGNLSFDVEEEF